MSYSRFYVTIIIFALSSLLIGFLMPSIISLYVVNGGSMHPCINEGDIVVINEMIDVDNLSNGDIVSIRLNNESPPFLKRIIALPYDTISYKNGNIYVNSDNILHKYNHLHFKDNDIRGAYFDSLNISNKYLTNHSNSNNFNSYILPNNKLFIIGDNIYHSSDSRNLGLIDFDKINGYLIFKL